MDLKRLNEIKKLLIAIIVLVPLSIILYVVGLINFIFPILIIGPLLLLAAGICELIVSIKILATKWENEEVNNNKIIWGILSLLLLPLIAPTIFYFSAKNRLNQNGSSTNNNESKNSENDSKKELSDHDKIREIKKLEEEGVLSKKEADKKIKEIMDRM